MANLCETALSFVNNKHFDFRKLLKALIMALEAILLKNCASKDPELAFLKKTKIPRLISATGDLFEVDGKDHVVEELASQAPNMTNSYQLAVPPFPNPAENLGKVLVDEAGRDIQLKFAHGTTTLGFRFKDGVVLAVDSRATGGMYIGSGSVKKIIEINKFLLGTMAGGAADCTYWERVLSKQCRLYELRNRERISVAAASKLLSNIAYNYKGMGLSMGVMIAGYDKRGPGLYYVDSDGSRTEGKVYSVGSGSIYAYGVLDKGYREDLKNEEAYELARRAIYHATFRDAGSGGIIRVYHMKKTGFEVISEEDCASLHYKYADEIK